MTIRFFWRYADGTVDWMPLPGAPAGRGGWRRRWWPGSAGARRLAPAPPPHALLQSSQRATASACIGATLRKTGAPLAPTNVHAGGAKVAEAGQRSTAGDGGHCNDVGIVVRGRVGGGGVVVVAHACAGARSSRGQCATSHCQLGDPGGGLPGGGHRAASDVCWRRRLRLPCRPSRPAGRARLLLPRPWERGGSPSLPPLPAAATKRMSAEFARSMASLSAWL